MPTKIIGQTPLDNNDAKNLFQFFKKASQKHQKVWQKGTSFHLADVEYTFGYTTVERQRQPGKEGVRYELISDKIQGYGCQGTKVFKVASTMMLHEDQVKFKNYGSPSTSPDKPEQKKRLVKIQYNLSPQQKSEVLHEYDMTRRAGHLAIKPPTIDHPTSYTVMREANGVELLALLDNDLQKIVELSLNQRLELTKALLTALKQQVFDKELVHRDIRPENIMVEMNSESFSIKIIDYARSHLQEVDPGDVGGCLPYAPPEAFARRPCTTKSDVFSMGRVLVLVWRGVNNTYNCNDKTVAAFNASNAPFLLQQTGLFLGLDNLSDVNKKIIYNTVESMLHPNPRYRPSVETALDAFNTVNLNETALVAEPDNCSFGLTPFLPAFFTRSVEYLRASLMGFFTKKESRTDNGAASSPTTFII